jgi:hypothetical protein
MNKKSIITLITVFLLVFVLSKLIVAQLCSPTQKNVVGNAASSIVEIVSTPASFGSPAKSDPLSWEPIMHQIFSFFSKACEH